MWFSCVLRSSVGDLPCVRIRLWLSCLGEANRVPHRPERPTRLTTPESARHPHHPPTAPSLECFPCRAGRSAPPIAFRTPRGSRLFVPLAPASTRGARSWSNRAEYPVRSTRLFVLSPNSPGVRCVDVRGRCVYVRSVAETADRRFTDRQYGFFIPRFRGLCSRSRVVVFDRQERGVASGTSGTTCREQT